MEVQNLYNMTVLKIVHFKISFKENRFEYMGNNLLVTHRILYRSREQHSWGNWGESTVSMKDITESIYCL